MDAFTLTISFIIISTFLAGFLRRLRKDKCLKDFQGDLVTLEKINGDIYKGALSVENTGLEFVYTESKTNKLNYLESSFIFYKYEYPQIQAIIRYHSDMDENDKKLRAKELERTYHPKFFRRLGRKFQNVFKTIRDSLIEILNVSMSHLQKTSTMAASVKNANKYLKPVNTELVESVGSAFEPMLEKYIGRKVVFELFKGKNKYVFNGVLKEYTANYLEIMDVDYELSSNFPRQKADIIVPQKYTVIRHLGEEIPENSFKIFRKLKRIFK